MESKPVSCKLKIPKHLNEKTPVFLVKFSNGNVNSDNVDKLKFVCYRPVDDTTGNSSARRILNANDGHLNFKSAPFDENNCDHNKCNYFVGVRNKKSGRMKIYESIQFHLKPVLKTDLKSTPSEQRNFREKMEELTMNFGSKGQKRSMAAFQKYSLDSALVSDTLEDMALDDYVDNTVCSVSVPKSSSNIEYMPPQNLEAKAVNEVYDINNIISTEEDEYLVERAEEFLEDLDSHLPRWKADGTYCAYVLNHLERELDREKVKYLIYYDYLVIFSKLLSNDIRKKDPAPQIPEPFKRYLLDNYTISSVTHYNKITRTFPQKMKDKLFAYILVLALFIDNYCVNLALVQHGMKCGMPKLTNIAQALGCHVNRRKVENSAIPFAELKFPLHVLQKRKF